ncbi:MAG: AAA family ATPase [Phycisphaerae bacterium]|nr:AAA family ATPase [Phycisphaerae bacterium]
MNISDTILQLEQIHQRLLLHTPRNLRPIFSQYPLSEKRAALLIGPRGTGKTTWLLECSRDNNILYLSVDHPMASGIRLFDIAQKAFQKGYDGLAIDEVHFSIDWSREIKAIYDSYPTKKIWVSDSSSLQLRKGIADLSRRFPRIQLPLLSFREYIFLKEETLFETFNPLEDTSRATSIFQTTNILNLFRQYIEAGTRPIFLEGDYEEKLQNIIEKTIFSDTPFLLPNVQERYLRLMNAVIGYLASSPIPTLNMASLSSDWGIGKEKLYELLNVLEHIGLINIVRYKRDHKVSGKGAKILLADSSMYHVLHGDIGNVREAFLVTAMRSAKIDIFASKDESKGDFIVQDMLIEVGGKTKHPKKADFVVRDDTELPHKNMLPLWTFGFMH